MYSRSWSNFRIPKTSRDHFRDSQSIQGFALILAVLFYSRFFYQFKTLKKNTLFCLIYLTIFSICASVHFQEMSKGSANNFVRVFFNPRNANSFSKKLSADVFPKSFNEDLVFLFLIFARKVFSFQIFSFQKKVCENYV